MGFIEDNFINPILQGTGYNIYNTLAYGVILIIALTLIIKLFKKKGINFDESLWFDLLPFVLLGGVSRALQDINTFDFLGTFNFLFVTPGIYLTMSNSVLGLIYFRNYLKKVGYVLLGISLVLILMNMQNILDFLLILIASIIIFVPVYYLLKKKTSLMNSINYMPLYAHILDSTSTVIAISFLGGFAEQHVLANAINAYLPFWMFIPIKIIAILLALWVIDKEKDQNWRWILKLAVFVLGMGPGIRNLFLVLLS